MQESDAAGFERAFRRLCAGYDTPPTEPRKDAYWRSFRKLSLLEFTGLVDVALTGSHFVVMPTVGALWDLHHKIQEPSPAAQQGPAGPSLQERLCAWVSPKVHAMMKRGEMTAWEFSRPWTYVYREWREGDKRCAECTGVVIEFGQGKRVGFKVSDMLAEVEARQLELT